MPYLSLIIVLVVWFAYAIHCAYKISKKTGFDRWNKWSYVAAFFLGLGMGIGAVMAGAAYVCAKIGEAMAKLKADDSK